MQEEIEIKVEKIKNKQKKKRKTILPSVNFNVIYGTACMKWNPAFTKNKDKKIIEFFYRRTNNRLNIQMPEKFKIYMKRKFREWKTGMLDFVFGYCEGRTNIAIIIPTHPDDSFSRNIGYDIITGKLRRALGEIKGREPYIFSVPFVSYAFFKRSD